MKLFNIRQVVFYCAASATLVFLLAIGFGLFPVVRVEESIPTIGGPEPPISEDSDLRLQTGQADSGSLRTVGNEVTFTADELDNIRVYEQRNEAVVNINTEVVAYNWFLEPVPQEGSTGSGSIIDARGYVLTNHHVVEKASKVLISLADRSQVEGEVVGTDPENDLAVVRFNPSGKRLSTIPMGSSAKLKVGQKVLAIGNPFAFDRTLTTGIVSGLGRPIRTQSGLVIQNMIQTDASINPGNSGGPLLDTAGNLIGINTMIFSPSGGSVGIGFAVPVDTARRVVPDLIQFGFVKRGWIDVVPVQLFPALVRYARLPVEQGLLVSRLISGGNAERAGIRGGERSNAVRYGRSIIYLGGDVIVEVDGVRSDSLADLFSALEDNKPGQTVNVVVNRSGREQTIRLPLSERPERLQWE